MSLFDYKAVAVVRKSGTFKSNIGRFRSGPRCSVGRVATLVHPEDFPMLVSSLSWLASEQRAFKTTSENASRQASNDTDFGRHFVPPVLPVSVPLLFRLWRAGRRRKYFTLVVGTLPPISAAQLRLTCAVPATVISRGEETSSYVTEA